MRDQSLLRRRRMTVAVKNQRIFALRQLDRDFGELARGYGGGHDVTRNDGRAGPGLDRFAYGLVAGQDQKNVEILERQTFPARQVLESAARART